VTSREEKMQATLDAAREKLRQADSDARALSQRLRGYDEQQTRINALVRLSDVLGELQSLGGDDPLTGEKLKKGGYDDALKRIQVEKDEHDTIVLKLKDELKQARTRAAELNLEYEKLAIKLQEDEKKRRKAALEAYRKEIREKGFQAREDDVFYRPMRILWRGDEKDNRRLRRISLLVLLFTLLLSVGVMNIIVPAPEVKETKLPPRLAKLVLEQQKQEQQPKQQQKEELKPTEGAPAPKSAAQARARAKAQKSGLLAMSSTFESLKNNTFEAKLAKEQNISVAGRHSLPRPRIQLSPRRRAKAVAVSTRPVSVTPPARADSRAGVPVVFPVALPIRSPRLADAGLEEAVARLEPMKRSRSCSIETRPRFTDCITRNCARTRPCRARLFSS